MAYEHKPRTALIHELEIANNAGTTLQGLSEVYAAIEYFESMVDPSVTLNLYLYDAADLRTKLPIVGGEKLYYNFSDTFEEEGNIISNGSPYKTKYGIGADIARPMKVYKISGRKRVREKVEQYVLSCSTRDFIDAPYRNIQKSWKQFDSVKVVNDILKMSFDVELETYDETKGLTNFVFTRETPFGAIEKVASESESKIEGDSNYFFWQTNTGYHFRSLESLLSQSPVRKYYYISGELECDVPVEGQRVVQLDEKTTFDMLDGVSDGQYSTNVRFYDPIAKKEFVHTYSHYEEHYGKYAKKGDKTAHPFIARNVSKELSKGFSVEKFLPTNYTSNHISYINQRDPNVRTSMRRRQNFLARDSAIKSQMETNIIELMVDGDSSLTAGCTIELNIPSPGENNPTEEVSDRLSSGIFLVTAVRHRVTSEDYFTIMSISKNSYRQNPDDVWEGW